MQKIFARLILLSATISVIAHAEYRVFTLKITNTQTKDYRLVDSTLDPIQYPYYYPVKKDEIVQYTDTWRCYGDTSGEKPHCPNPRLNPEAAAQANAGQPAQAPAPAQNQGPAPGANP